MLLFDPVKDALSALEKLTAPCSWLGPQRGICQEVGDRLPRGTQRAGVQREVWCGLPNRSRLWSHADDFRHVEASRKYSRDWRSSPTWITRTTGWARSARTFEVGASPTVARGQLRHIDARITLGIYGHVIGDSQRNAVERVAQIARPDAPKLETSGEWISVTKGCQIDGCSISETLTVPIGQWTVRRWYAANLAAARAGSG